ncbi:hypothetical protein D3C87_2186270 [compost metagenome]
MQVTGNIAAGFVDARGTGAYHDTDARVAVTRDGLADIVFDLPGGSEQQPVVAAVVPLQSRRQ